ncbi:MAG TPA: protein kinase [Gemmatimonadales bacterium]|nr:protein kinase [Gemmatimonadales bacterium]
MSHSEPITAERLQQAFGADYEILRPLGHGGMATVWLARERSLKRLVAIKVLDPDLGGSATFRSRFQLEAETAAQLQHPNIVPIFRVGEAGGLAYYAMAYVEGESLADRLRGRTRLGHAEARRLAAEVAAALGAAHRRGIIHRDVKPQNVLLDRETGRAMVTDFGIASVAAAHAKADDEGRLTNAGMVMGTPRYMSPEQASGERTLTPASDLYALGILLYEMLSGEYPYRLADPPNYMLAHIAGTPIPLVTRVGDVPADLEQLVHQLLAKEPGERVETAEAVVERLRTGGEVTGSGERRQRAARRRRVMPLLLTLLAVLLGAGVVFGRGGSDLPKGVDPRRSLLIGFFDNTQQKPELDWLRVGGVDLLGQALGSWQDLTVVDAERLLDLARRLDVDPKARLSQEDVLRLAREAGVWTATVGSVSQFGDSLSFTLKVYDVARGELLTTARAAVPDTGDVPGAFRALAREVLATAGAPSQLADVEPPTRSIAAYRAYIEGIQARSRWDIAEATSAFRRAVAADPGFALAYYELSQALSASDAFNPGGAFLAAADSALRYAADRPPRERALIEGYHAIMRADMPRARAKLGALVAEDSLRSDAWFWLGFASQYDLTLRRDANGREVLPADLTLAMRAYARALELDGSDHRFYLQLAQLLSGAGLREAQGVPAYREPPPDNFQSFFLRPPVAYYTPVLRGDAITLLPADSLARLRPAELDSLRQAARDRTALVVRRWITVAPDEGTAYLMLARLEYDDKSYDGALRALEKAESLNAFTQAPIPLQRLGVLMAARRFEQAGVIGDSLAPIGGAPAPLASPLLGSAVAQHLFLRGRVADAAATWRRTRAELRRFEGSAALKRRLALTDTLVAVSFAARVGTLTPAEYGAMEALGERFVEAAPEAERPQLRRQLARTMLLGAAALGDSAAARKWRGAWGSDSLLSLDAAAMAAAGDRTRALGIYGRAERDTTSDAVHLFALGVTAQALGRPADAARHYARLDSIDVESSNWALVSRSYARRAEVAAQLGDTAAARRDYDVFLSLWKDADAPLQAEVQAARRARGELSRPQAR